MAVSIKSEREIQLMRESCKILAKVYEELEKAIKPGVSTKEIDTLAEKLEAFKTFLATNATAFGVQYDPVDRRADAFKFPGSYDAESFAEYSKKMLAMALEGALESVQNNVIAKMVKNELLAEGSMVQYGIGEPSISAAESYSNGKLKYATAIYPVAIAVNGGLFAL
mgnify:CR=1 FL=1